MIETRGDMWELLNEYDAVCITTNGYINKKGECVMGRGTAYDCANIYKGSSKLLGNAIKKFGNRVIPFINDTEFGTVIVSFPVKHTWNQMADIDLIVKSAYQLVELATHNNWSKVLLPKPGCGNGDLHWEFVKPYIENILDDRFTIIDK